MLLMKKLFLSLLSLLALGAGLTAQEITSFWGYHTQLFGYEDRRYVDGDNGDYLKTFAQYLGAEFVQRGVKTDSPDSEHIVLGGAVLLYVQNSFSPRTLYAVVPGATAAAGAPTLSEQIVPSDIDDRAARFQLTGSVFGGYQDEWWGAEGGLSVFVKGFEEKVRKRYNRVGEIVEGDGRGWVFGNGSLILPNFRLRVGTEVLPHFVVTLHREHYDPGYGAFQARVVLPFGDLFKLQVGGSMFQTSSIFVEPTVNLGGVSLAVRGGTILNYNDKAFTRVGIFEGLFVAASAGYRW